MNLNTVKRIISRELDVTKSIDFISYLETSNKVEEFKSILDQLDRGSGRTTRLIDSYIQELFLNGEVTPRDHHDNKMSHLYLTDKIRARLNSEHPNLVYDIFNSTSIKLTK